jgi:hypothetical protein
VFARLRATYDAWNAELLPPLEPQGRA